MWFPERFWTVSCGVSKEVGTVDASGWGIDSSWYKARVVSEQYHDTCCYMQHVVSINVHCSHYDAQHFCQPYGFCTFSRSRFDSGAARCWHARIWHCFLYEGFYVWHGTLPKSTHTDDSRIIRSVCLVCRRRYFSVHETDGMDISQADRMIMSAAITR